MLLFLTGLTAIVCQIVLLRELNVASYGVELIYAIALAGWMVAGGLGAACRVRRRAVPSRVAWLLLAAAVALPFDVAFVRASRLIFGGVAGAYLPFGRQLLVVALSLTPISLVLGLAFRRAAEAAALHGQSLASSYAVEGAGAVVGAAAATFALVSGVQTFALAVATATLLAAVPLLGVARKPTLAAAFALAALLALPLAPTLDLAMTRWTHPAAVETRDSPYARITATVEGGQTALFADDVLVYESQSARQEELADIAALAHPNPKRILLLGGTAERLEPELRRHHPIVVYPVEIDRVLFRIADARLGLGSKPIFDDPRDFLRRDGRYDVIVVAMPEPTTGQSNRFYTSEFFAECRRHLAPGGVLAFRLSLPDNIVTPLLALRTASIIAAVRSALPHVEVLQGDGALVFASAAPLPAGADILAERLNARGVRTRLVTPAYLRYLYENDRRETLAALAAMPAPPNSDARPICYPFAAVHWLARFYPELLRAEPRLLAGAPTGPAGSADLDGWLTAPLTATNPRLIAAALALAFALAARRVRRLRTTLLAGLAGLSGMLLETVLLLAYQARSGALYERVGLLLMAFMAGLSAGAWVVSRAARPSSSGATLRRLTMAAVAALAAVGWATATLIAAGSPMGLALTGLVLLAGGAAVGAIFACAAGVTETAGESGLGRLYGADMAGGAIGSLLASLLLVPAAGLVPTTWAVVGLGLAGLLLA